MRVSWNELTRILLLPVRFPRRPIQKKSPAQGRGFFLERAMGIEPTWPGWKPGALPLSYTRMLIVMCEERRVLSYGVVRMPGIRTVRDAAKAASSRRKPHGRGLHPQEHFGERGEANDGPDDVQDHGLVCPSRMAH